MVSDARMETPSGASANPDINALERFQEKCAAVFPPELRQSKETEHFRDSTKHENALAAGLLRRGDDAVRRNPELVALLMEHDDLDGAIAALSQVSASDDQRVARLKKRKLLLRDRIAAKAAGRCRTGAY